MFRTQSNFQNYHPVNICIVPGITPWMFPVNVFHFNIMPPAILVMPSTSCYQVSSLPLWYNVYFIQWQRKKCKMFTSGDLAGHDTHSGLPDHHIWLPYLLAHKTNCDFFVRNLRKKLWWMYFNFSNLLEENRIVTYQN